MRKLLLSTVSVAALVTLAACSDETAENQNDDAVAVEETAEIDTTVPTTDGSAEQTADAETPAADPAAPSAEDPQMQADADAGEGSDPGVVIDETDTADADAVLPADMEEAQQALNEARSAIRVESETEAIQALMNVESALGTSQDTADARDAVDDARDAVVSGEFDVALSALDEVETALQVNGQASTEMPPSDETTSSTAE